MSLGSETLETAQPGTRYKWIVLGIIGLGSFLTIMDAGMVGIGLPALIDAFNTNANVIVWVGIINFVGNTGPILVFGWVADTIGRKRMYLAGTLIVFVSLGLSAASQSVGQLIATRFIGALGYSMMMANDNALLTDGFPANERGKAQGINNVALGLGIGLGVLFGGILVDEVGWRSLFWVRLAPHALLALLVWRFIKNDPLERSSAVKIDYTGALLITASLFTGLLAINQAGRLGVQSPIVISLALITVVLIPTILLTEKRAAFPIIELKLFKNRVFSSGVTAQVFAQIAHGGWIFLAPFFLIQGLGQSATFAGLMIFPFHAIRLFFSPISGFLADRLGTRLPSALGLVLLVGGLLTLSLLATNAPIWQIVASIAVSGTGLAMFLPANNNAIMSHVPRQFLSSASGFLAASRALGASIGSTLAVAIYASSLESVSPTPEAISNAFGNAVIVLVVLTSLGFVAIYARGKA